MENQKSNSQFYLLGCFAPSYDRYHQQTQLMHLVGSVFYTTKLNWMMLFQSIIDLKILLYSK